MEKRQIVIIGGGIGGLAAAIRLKTTMAQSQVVLLEKNAKIGGKLNLWEIPNPAQPHAPLFRFDTGPSLLTLPLVFADLFAYTGRDVRNYLPIRRLDPVSRFVWRDGKTLTLHATRSALMNEIRRFAPEDQSGVEALLNRGRKIWDLSGDFFLGQSLEQALRGDGRLSPFRGLRMLSVPFRIGMFQKYAKLVDRHIRSPRLREVFYQYATYSGASPFLAPATLVTIPHVELDQGAWYVEGGMYRLAEALGKLAREIGVEIRTGCAARRVLIESGEKPHGKQIGKVRGVELQDGSELPADAVVINADVPYAYEALIEPHFRPRFNDERLAQLEPGGSGMVLMLGVEGTYPQLAHHTKFMPDDYRSDLRAMFETRTIPEDPCIYVCAPCRTDPTQAPPGCENLFILCSAPPLDGKIDWSTAGPAYRDQIVRTLEMRGLTDLSKRIVVEKLMSPLDLQTTYNANAGSIYGISGNGLRNAFMRPPNRDRDIAGLFFAGGATHPGGGLPLVALSGKIASNLAMEYLNS